MLVAFADAGINTLHLDLKRDFTVFEVVGIENNRAGIIGKTTVDLGIDVIDTEIEVCMLLVNFPGTGFGMPGGSEYSDEHGDNEGKQYVLVHRCLHRVKRIAL